MITTLATSGQLNQAHRLRNRRRTNWRRVTLFILGRLLGLLFGAAVVTFVLACLLF